MEGRRRICFRGVTTVGVALLIAGGMLGPALFNSPAVSAQNRQVTDADSSRVQFPHGILYDDPEMFNQLSGVARTLLEMRFGKKSPVPKTHRRRNETISPETFTQPPNVLVNNPADDTTAQDTQSETTIVLGAGSNVLVGFNDSESNLRGNTRHFTGYSVSGNGGTSFTDQGNLPDSTEGDSGDPVLAYSTASGTTFLATLGFHQFNSVFFNSDNIQVFRVFNNATTFGAPVDATPGFFGSGDFQDKEWIAVDNFAGAGRGNVYLAWRDFQNFSPTSGATPGIRFTRSTDDGTTWGPNQGLLIAGPFNVQGAFVAVGPDHSVYVFWLDQSGGSGTPNIIKMRKSQDQGISFGPVVDVATLNATGMDGDLGLNGGFRTNCFPQAAVNPVTGALYVVYNDATNGADRADIFFTQSLDGGSSWSAPVRVNDDATTNDQWQPVLAVAPNGSNLFIGFYDRRLSSSNSSIDTFGVSGAIINSSVVFDANSRITTQSFPVAIGQDPVIVSNYMGDYDQAACDGRNFYYSWGDNRDSDASHANEPNVRFAKINANVINNERFFVRQQYLDFFGQGPDQGGWDYWTNQITAYGPGLRDQRRAAVSLAFFYSTQFLNNHPGLRNPPGTSPDFNNSEFVRQCYLVYLRRNPDDGGFQFWLNILNQNNDYAGLVSAFITSAEYLSRFGPL